jgi:hypothetical protein
MTWWRMILFSNESPPTSGREAWLREGREERTGEMKVMVWIQLLIIRGVREVPVRGWISGRELRRRRQRIKMRDLASEVSFTYSA